MKQLKRILIVIILVIAATMLLIAVSLNSLVKTGVETLGPQLTKSAVTLRKVKISPFTGRGELRGLVVANPEGYRTPAIFSLEHIAIHVSLPSLLTDRIIVKEIVIEGPDVTYEASAHGNNVKTIMKNVEEFAGPAKEPTESAKTTTKKSGKKIQVDHVLIRDGKLSLSSKILQGNALHIPLPKIELHDIGKEGKGTSVADVVHEILAAILDVTKSVGAGVGGVVESLGKAVKGKDGTREVQEEVSAAVKEAVDKLTDPSSNQSADEAIKEGVRKLLKKK